MQKWKKAVLFSTLLLLGALIAYGYWEFFIYEPPLLTYNEAYDEAQFQIQQYCKSLKRTPCDYQFVRVTPNTKHAASWTFEFESSNYSDIGVVVFNDGDSNVLWSP